MSECDFLEVCPFFNNKLDIEVEKVEEMKEKYCKTNNLNCARYMIANAVGEEHVPHDLSPHEKMQAYALIAEKG